jgi:uncharacterized protein
MIPIILSAFALGILGSLHCIGMCGPLVMSMPFQKARGGKIVIASILYHIGKAITYSLFGLLAGTIGKGFVFFKWQQSHFFLILKTKFNWRNLSKMDLIDYLL